jgi:predicted transposase YbfD/YdcC
MRKGAKPLVAFLSEIPDPRDAKGRRHSLTLILLLVFVATLQGSQSLKDASLFGKINQKLFERILGVTFCHGIPRANTISSVLQAIDPDLLVNAFLQFLELLGITITTTDVLSFDGKTIRGANGEGVIRHMLSLFSHGSHLAIGQVGVAGKESEIAALERLLEQATRHDLIAKKLLLGDALHTQKTTVDLILTAGADYLFVVKGNQPGLKTTILRETEAAIGGASATDSFTMVTTDRKREITTTVTTLRLANASDAGRVLLGDWHGVKTIGILHRTGTRVSKDGTVAQVDETVGFISSRILSAKAIATHLHNHWCIENNLHWVKDEVYGEDKHTLRKGKAPQVMSYIRSMCITVCNVLKVRSISDVIHNVQKSTRLLGQFLRMGAIV